MKWSDLPRVTTVYLASEGGFRVYAAVLSSVGQTWQAKNPKALAVAWQQKQQFRRYVHQRDEDVTPDRQGLRRVSSSVWLLPRSNDLALQLRQKLQKITQKAMVTK